MADEDKDGAVAEFRGYFTYILFVLGFIPSTLSLISFAQRVFSVSLIDTFAAIVTFYREAIYPAFDFVSRIIPIDFADWYKDALVINFFLGNMLLRSFVGLASNDDLTVGDHIRMTIIGSILSLVLGALLVTPVLLAIMTLFTIPLTIEAIRRRPSGPNPMNDINELGCFLVLRLPLVFIIYVAATVAACVVFFALNANT